MTKLLVIPSDLKMIEQIKHNCDGFIIGLENLSVNLPITFSKEQVQEIVCQNMDKDIFVAINKNIHNKEIEQLKEVLLYLDDLSIAGIIYYDVAVVELKKKLGLKKELVWNQEHLSTNYATCNFWQKFDVNYAYLSSDITLQEIIDIRKKTKARLLVNIFGYLPMFASYRHLVKNYSKTFNLPFSSYYQIEKEGNSYPIVDNHLGSFVYSSKVLNGIHEYLLLQEQDIDYVVLNSFQIPYNDFTKIVELFAKVDNGNVEAYSKKIEKMCPNWDKGFFYKETVYKVKNNE